MTQVESTLAGRVLDLVQTRLRSQYPGTLITIRTEGHDRIVVIYHEIHNEHPRVLGLIRDLEPDYTPAQLADEIVDREIAEPLGSLDHELDEADGIHWHHGNHPEWRYYY